MKNKTNYFVLLCSVLIFFGCANKSKSDEISQIDVVSADKNKQNINFSDIVESIEYVELSSKDSLVGQASRIFVDNENIVVIAFKQQYLFDRATGAFIRKIGEFDKGPDGFRFTKTNLVYNESEKTVYSGGWDRNILEYSIQGKVIRTFDKPTGRETYGAFTKFNDSLHVAYFPNLSGDDTSKIVLLSGNSNHVKEFVTNDYFEKNPKFFRTWGGDREGWFYRFNNNLFFKELFNDTIFQINDMELTPKYCFQLGDFAPPGPRRNFYEEMQDFYFVERIFETDNFLFFTFNYKNELRCSVFDKKNNQTFISNEKEADISFLNTPYRGFNNDIDGFIQFAPQYMNQSKEIIASAEAFEVVAWFNKNPEKAANLPPHLLKLKNIKETNNPVVMIAKLKE